MVSLSSCVGIYLSLLAFGDAPKSEMVKFQTSDGVQLSAEYFPPTATKGGKAPVTILIHMYSMDHKSWSKLVGPLHDAGFAILAFDIRGKGGSQEPAKLRLPYRYGTLDATFFAEAWRDAQASFEWLSKRAECDTTHCVIIGADIGASIAIDYARREPSIKAIVGLSPQSDPPILGIPILEHIKKCDKQAIYFIAPEKEYSHVEKLIEATKGAAKGEHFPGHRPEHGTNLMDQPTYGQEVIDKIVAFVKKGVGLSDVEAKKESAKKR